MNGAHLHLIVTHLPIVGLLAAFLVNLYAIISKNDEIKRLSLWAYVVLGVFGLLAYLTGDSAEEVLLTYPGFTEDMIEPHETMGLLFFIGLMIMTAGAFAGLYLSKTKEALLKKFNLYLLFAAILVAFLAVRTGSTGGEIRHPEVRQGIYSPK
jgi:uncharacterized membrane protein